MGFNGGGPRLLYAASQVPFLGKPTPACTSTATQLLWVRVCPHSKATSHFSTDPTGESDSFLSPMQNSGLAFPGLRRPDPP